MQPLYTLNKSLMPKLEPKIYSTKKKKTEGIFDIPIDNAIATNKIDNAITLIEFRENKVKYNTIKKDFLDYVDGGQNIFLPIFSDDKIGYSMTRGFLLFNIKNKKFNYYSIAGNFNYDISQIVPVNEKKQFLFVIRDLSNKKGQILRLVDLSSDRAIILNEKIIEKGGIEILQNIIFIYSKNTIRTLDLNFDEIEHPIVEIFNRMKDREIFISELIIHPVLPFAIFNEYKRRDINNLWIISWDTKNTDNNYMKILLKCDASNLRFSYDNKWLLIKNATNPPGNYVLMSVDPENSEKIGYPFDLGMVPEFPSGIGTSAMTRNPSGLVVSECEGYKGKCWLKKWDFTEAEKLIEKNK